MNRHASRRPPSLNGLRAFDATARLLSFTRAAGELHVTHGAVSRQVAALEDYFGTPLFIRGARGLKLTAQGMRLAASTQPAFEMLHDAVLEVAPRSANAPVRISVPPTLAMWWLIPRLSALYGAHPDLPIEISTSTEPADFSTGEYDVAIRRIDAPPKNLYAASFLDGRSVAVCSPKYQKEHRVRVRNDLGRATLLIPHSDPGAWDQWLRANRIRRAPKAPVLMFDYLYFAVQAALDSLGVALVPQVLVARAVHEGKLRVLDKPLASSPRTYALLAPKMAARQPAVMALAAWLKREGEG